MADGWTGNRAPRGPGEIAAVLAGRPPGWEYLYFAGCLLNGRDAVQERARTAAGQAAADDHVDDQVVMDYVQHAIDDIQALVASLTPLFAPEVLAAAFGPPGQPGDPVRLRQLAERWNGVYELLLGWGRRLRDATPSVTYRGLFEALAALGDRPVRQYHDFVDQFIAEADDVPGAIASGVRRSIDLTLKLDIDAGAMAAFEGQLDAVRRQLFGRQVAAPDAMAAQPGPKSTASRNPVVAQRSFARDFLAATFVTAIILLVVVALPQGDRMVWEAWEFLTMISIGVGIAWARSRRQPNRR